MRLNRMFLPFPTLSLGQNLPGAISSLKPCSTDGRAEVAQLHLAIKERRGKPPFTAPRAYPVRGGLEPLPCIWSHAAAGRSSYWQFWAAQCCGVRQEIQVGQIPDSTIAPGPIPPYGDSFGKAAPKGRHPSSSSAVQQKDLGPSHIWLSSCYAAIDTKCSQCNSLTLVLLILA